MRRLISSAFSLVGLAVALYVYFFVPLGARTLHEHALRIAHTEPAEELGGEVREATDRLLGHVVEEWDSRYGADAGLDASGSL